MRSLFNPTLARRSIATLLLALSTLSARAEPGVTNDAVLIGRTTGVTGPVAGMIQETTEAIDAYVAWVNQHGGVNGRKIVIKTLDDGFDPKRAGVNAQKLIGDDQVFALLMPRGTPHTEAVLQVAEPNGVPVIAPSTGAEIFHTPVRPLVFNVRAKYQDEVIAAIRHFTALAITRIAIVAPTDSFGKDALDGYERGMAKEELKPTLIARFDRAKGDSTGTVPDMLKADPQAVIVAASGSAAVTFIREMRARGSTAQMVTLSNNSSSSFVHDLGSDARGVLMTQVTPVADNGRTEISREFIKIAKASGATPSYAGMEAFCAVKVMVEGLQRAGRNLTRKGFVAALNGMRRNDLGDFVIDYSPNHHSGSSFVEMSMIGVKGNFIR